jgi:DNA-binding MarR family transcriptional regulator
MSLARQRLASLPSVTDTDVVLSAVWINMLSRRYAAWIHTTTTSVGLDENEAAILVAIGLDDPQGVTAVWLTATLMITSGGITRAIDRLVDKGLVTRKQDPDDRRRVRLRLTAKGRRRSDELLEIIVHRHGERVARLTPARRQEILVALDDLLTLYDDIDTPH